MSYKVIRISKYWGVTPGGNTALGSCKPWIPTFLSDSQYVALFYVCFCLKIPYLIYIVDPLTLQSQPTAAITRAWRKLVRVLRETHQNQPPALGTRQHHSTALRAVLNSKISHKKRQKNVKNVAVSGLWKDIVWGERGGEGLPCWTSTGIVHVTRFKFFTALHVSTNDHKTPQILIRGYK